MVEHQYNSNQATNDTPFLTPRFLVPMKKRLQRIIAQGHFLDEVMAWKRQQLQTEMAEMPETSLQALLAFTPPAQDFAASLAGSGISLIAEIKRAAPNKGLITRDFDAVQLAQTYIKGGAAALACTTDARFFQGHLQDLTAIKEHFRQHETPHPLLRQDFIVHPWQILQSRVAGADSLTLIMALLGDADYANLLAYARELGMEPVVQVHDEADLQRALMARPRILHLNHRDWRTLAIDATVSARLRPHIPDDVHVIAGGGIRHADDIAALRPLALHAVMVGESLARQSGRQRLRKTRHLVAAGQGKQP